MVMKRLRILTVFLLLTILALTGCQSQQSKEATVNFPEKSIEIIVPYAAGGGTDAVARALADAAKDCF